MQFVLLKEIKEKVFSAIYPHTLTSSSFPLYPWDFQMVRDSVRVGEGSVRGRLIKGI